DRRALKVRRVLMTADAVGGVWRYSLDLSAALAARGIHTTIAVLGPAPSATQRREAARAGVPVIDGGFRLEWMEGGLDDIAASGAWLQMLERGLCPDVVHLNGFSHAQLPWRVPTVVVAHSCVRTWWRAVHAAPPPSGYDDYATAVTRGLRAANAVVAPSRAMAEELSREYGLTRDQRVIANGSTVSALPAVEAKAPVILCAGRAWDPAKNIQALCTVAPALSWPVHVAGETRDPDGSLREFTGVRTLGVLSSRAMRACYDRASIYALPARYEPFGLSVLEAASRGCALVLGDIPSLREHWHDAALFVAPDDHPALREALQRLIDTPSERTALARRAWRRARRFTLARTADAYVRLYERLVA
ncbi:MAG TPA: glycosyltransferase family 4 protein, partial [Luteitalea sp.]|nr:glycosyltransferase family 4 protein [Luteitalea sp.]